MSDLDRALRRHRTALSASERDSRLAMRRAYRQAIASLQDDLKRAERRIAEIQASGERVPRWRLVRETQLHSLIAQAEFAFTQYGRTVSREVLVARADAAARAEQDALRLIEAGFGPGPAGAALPLARLPQGALVELTGALRPGSPLAELFQSFGAEAAKAVEEALVGGMAAGKNSAVIARDISRRLGINQTRAETIARTELHRAYRSAALETMRQNKHLLRGWRWSAAKSARTCPVCLALDGRIFDLDEPPRMHVSCRCSCVPVPKSYRDLGYDVPEITTIRQSGADWFQRQPAAIQREVLGPAAHAAYDAGEIDLEDLVRLRRSRVWGSSYVRGSLAGARERAQKRERKAA